MNARPHPSQAFTAVRRRGSALALIALAGCLVGQCLAAGAPSYTFFHAGVPATMNTYTESRLVLANGPLPTWPALQRFVVLSWDDNGGGGFIWTDGGVYFGIIPAGYAPKGIVGGAIALNTPDNSKCGWWQYQRGAYPPMPVNTQSYAPSDCNLHGMTVGPTMIGRGMNSAGVDTAIEIQCSSNPRINNCGMTVLPSLGGGDTAAWGINSSGVVVGQSNFASGQTRAYTFTPGNSAAADLDPFHTNYNSFGTAINESNQAVGFILPGPCPPSPLICKNGQFLSHTTNSHYIPVMFSTNFKNTVPISLGSLGGTDGTAQAINNYGVIVGWSLNSQGAQHGFMYANGVMTDLNNLGASGAQGWTITEAWAVNDEGQIVGRAVNAQGQTEVYILTP